MGLLDKQVINQLHVALADQRQRNEKLLEELNHARSDLVHLREQAKKFIPKQSDSLEKRLGKMFPDYLTEVKVFWSSSSSAEANSPYADVWSALIKTVDTHEIRNVGLRAYPVRVRGYLDVEVRATTAEGLMHKIKLLAKELGIEISEAEDGADNGDL